jgi:2-hydroxychromene-2-carboxylate isomerase
VRVEFWFDFSCPYAYLASRRIAHVVAGRATLALCPMLLGGVFRAIGAGEGPMATQSMAKAAHNTRDMHRWAERMDIPFRLPAGHPMRTVRVLRVLLGLPRDAWCDAMHAVYAAYWQRGENVAGDDAIRGALAGAGIAEPIVAAAFAAADTDAIKGELRRWTDLAVARGVFGAPAMVVDRGRGAPILLWGQDRLSFLDAVLDGWDPDDPASAPPGGTHPLAPVTARRGGAIDFYFDFSSPWAYLGSTQIAAIAGDALRWRPILLGGLFRDLGTPDVPLFAFPASKRHYAGLDLGRWARWWGVPFRFPARFPQRTVTALRLVMLAGDRAPALIERLFRAMWVEDQVIEDDAVVARMAAEVGVDPALVARTTEPAAKDALRAATDAARAAGVFGVPTTIAGGELYWGQDRLDLVAEAVAMGLGPRASGLGQNSDRA